MQCVQLKYQTLRYVHQIHCQCLATPSPSCLKVLVSLPIIRISFTLQLSARTTHPQGCLGEAIGRSQK